MKHTHMLLLFAVVCGVLFRSGNAQVLQLPTLRVFRVNTGVSVPDRGATYLGGVDRAAVFPGFL